MIHILWGSDYPGFCCSFRGGGCVASLLTAATVVVVVVDDAQIAALENL